jgi:hypothetical protein
VACFARGGPTLERARPPAKEHTPLLEAHFRDLLYRVELESPAEPPDANGEQPRPVTAVEDVLELSEKALR